MTTAFFNALRPTLNQPGVLDNLLVDATAMILVAVSADGRAVAMMLSDVIDQTAKSIGKDFVPVARIITAGTGLDGGGALGSNLTIDLDSATIASLSRADSAVQPARAISAGTGLTGGGNLSSDRSLALSSGSIASLAKADTAIQPSAIGVANGIVPLGADAKISESFLPAIAISDTFVVANQAAMLALTAERGDIAIRTDENKTYVLSAAPASTLANWAELRSPTAAVTSVAGKIGVVTLVVSDIGGLQTALDAKATLAVVNGGANGLMLAADKTKLDGIAAGATANAADIFLLARENHTGTQSADTIVDGSTNKVFTSTDEAKLAGIANGATVNSTDSYLTNRENHYGTQSADSIVDGTANKVYTAGEKSKLAGIANGATANSADAALLARSNHTGSQSADTVTDSGTKVLMTPDERSKLAGVAVGADVTPARLGNWCQFVDDWNDVVTNGFFESNTAANSPISSDWFMGIVVVHDPNYVEQRLHAFVSADNSDSYSYRRQRIGGVWGAWMRTYSTKEELEDLIAATLEPGANISVTYNDSTGKISIAATGTISTAASAVTVTPVGGVAATNVQAAIQELDAEKRNGYIGNVSVLNDATAVGTYILTDVAITNHPEPGGYYWIFVESNGDAVGQTAKSIFSQAEYRRYRSGGTWTAWVKTMEHDGAAALNVRKYPTLITDANNWKEAGTAYGEGILNSPVSPGGGGGTVAWFSYSYVGESNWGTQTAVSWFNFSTYVRQNHGGTWTAWAQFKETDGKDSFALPKTGGTLTGQLALGYDSPAQYWGTGNNSWRAIKSNPQGTAGPLVFQHSADGTFGAPTEPLILSQDGTVYLGNLSGGVGTALAASPNQPTVSHFGHKTMRSVLLGAGTDFNAITDSGVYDCDSPVNAPYSGANWWYLEVIRHNAGGTYCVQRAIQLNNTAAGTVPTTWIRKAAGGGWGYWYPESGFATPEHYGASGDQTTDDTAAIIRCFRDAVIPIQLLGYYRITDDVQFGWIYTGDGILIQGQAKKHFILDAATARLAWVGPTPDNRQNAMLVAKDFSFISNRSDHGVAALTLAASGGSGSTTKTFDIRNVNSFGADDSKGAFAGIELSNQRNGIIDSCIHQGIRSQTPGSRTGAGIIAGGTGDPVDFSIINCHGYFTAKAVSLTGTLEGINVDKHVAVACDRGVNAELDENPISGDNEGKPLLKITDGHFNCRDYGIYMDRVRDYSITGNDMLVEQANSNWNGIYSDVDGSASVYGWIDGNRFQDAWGVSSGTTIGINLDAHTSGVTDSRVGVNRYISTKIGLNIGANVRNLRYSAASVYAGVTTDVSNAGGGSNTAY